MHPILDTAITAARKAGQLMLRFQERLDQLTITRKEDDEVVSDADRMAEELIIEIVQQTYPQHAILAEESGDKHSPADPEPWQWFIDPIDGTQNYLQGRADFCVSIAVAHEGRLEHAVIFAPRHEELYTASRGQGAQLERRRIRVRRIETLKDGLVASGFCGRGGQKLGTALQQMRRITGQAAGLRITGSAALELANLAAGRLDGFWHAGLSAWDTAAGILLVREAGGLATDFSGNSECLQSPDLVAGGPTIFSQLRALVEPTRLTRLP